MWGTISAGSENFSLSIHIHTTGCYLWLCHARFCVMSKTRIRAHRTVIHSHTYWLLIIKMVKWNSNCLKSAITQQPTALQEKCYVGAKHFNWSVKVTGPGTNWFVSTGEARNAWWAVMESGNPLVRAGTRSFLKHLYSVVKEVSISNTWFLKSLFLQKRSLRLPFSSYPACTEFCCQIFRFQRNLQRLWRDYFKGFVRFFPGMLWRIPPEILPALFQRVLRGIS